MKPSISRSPSVPSRLALALVCLGVLASAQPSGRGMKVVTYEAFGAVGDGKTDDLPAICAAHEHANAHGLPVRTKPGAVYHVGRRKLTAIIQTDTDWGSSRFIIDDSEGIEDPRQSIFAVRSSLKPIPLKIERLRQGQKRLEFRVPADCVVHVENAERKRFIRRGRNQNSGSSQSEVFIVRQDGRIEPGIDWDYDKVTRASAQPIDPKPLLLRGGIFTQIANRAREGDPDGYWARNIHIQRSQTVVEGITQSVTGEGETGNPYSGFLQVSRCTRVLLRNCKVDGRKTYIKIGRAGKPVPSGSYGYHASHVIDFQMVGCSTGTDIMDRSRWGVVATNFMKNFTVDHCVLSRVDVHQGVSGDYTIRNTTLGHAGLNAIGRGRLLVENSTIHGSSFIRFREDYGSTWDGTIQIRNCRWIPGKRNERHLEIFDLSNDGTHDFGYPCSMPRHIEIDGLFIDDSKTGKSYQGPVFFGDVLDGTRKDRPSPYRLTETIRIHKLETASGRKVQVSSNPKIAEAIQCSGGP